jgi:hypothetical protein
MGASRLTDLQVTPSVLAEQMGWSRFRAYREMLRIERAFPGVVRRQGNRLVADESKIAPHIHGFKPSRLELEVRRLRAELQELGQRLDAEVRARLLQWQQRQERR